MLTVTAGQVKCGVGVSCAKGVRERRELISCYSQRKDADDEADADVEAVDVPSPELSWR